jgi:hypothetical protein
MKKHLLVLCALIIAAEAYAGDSREILDIRARYQAVAGHIARNELFVDEHVFNKTALAIPDLGFMVTTVRVYFNYSPTVEGLTIPEKIEITGTYKGNTTSTEYTEYVYDDTGKLVFCLIKYGNDRIERRFYFRGTQAIRVQTGDKILDPSLPDFELFSKEALSQSNAWKKRLGW